MIQMYRISATFHVHSLSAIPQTIQVNETCILEDVRFGEVLCPGVTVTVDWV